MRLHFGNPRNPEGPLITVLSCLVIEYLIQQGWNILTPLPVLLPTIVFATFVGSLGIGLISAAIVFLYCVHFYWERGQYGILTGPGQARLTLIALSSVVMVLMVEVLRRRLLARERARVQEALDQANQRVFNIMSTVTEPMLAVDKDWRIVQINDVAARDAGTTREQLIGDNLWERFPQLTGTPIETHYRRAMEEQTVIHFTALSPNTNHWYELDVFPSPHGMFIFGRRTERRPMGELLVG